MSNKEKITKVESKQDYLNITYEQVTSSPGLDEKTLEPIWIVEAKARAMARANKPTSPDLEQLR